RARDVPGQRVAALDATLQKAEHRAAAKRSRRRRARLGLDAAEAEGCRARAGRRASPERAQPVVITCSPLPWTSYSNRVLASMPFLGVTRTLSATSDRSAALRWYDALT